MKLEPVPSILAAIGGAAGFAILVGILLPLLAGCASVQPMLELREKPAHTCTGWRACFGQLWLGFKVPIH